AEPSLIELLAEFLIEWEAIKAEIEAISKTNAPEWFQSRTRFEDVGENFKGFLEAFYVVVTTLAESIQILDTTEGDIRDTWKAVHQDLVLNRGYAAGGLTMAQYLHT